MQATIPFDLKTRTCTVADAPEYDALYLQGIRHFNECEFFEAHDVWEELWTEYRGSARDFYKGLIQSAVCLHHFGNGNIRGARKLFVSSTAYLKKYAPDHLGLDIDQFSTQMETCCREIMASTDEFPKIDIVPDLIPEIDLDPPPATLD